VSLLVPIDLSAPSRIAIELAVWLGKELSEEIILLHISPTPQNSADAIGSSGKIQIIVDGKRILVQDDGPGVAPEILERLFEPFVTSKTRGTGLGLAISRKLADAMGARLEYKAGQPGAVFSLEF
jgi:nitrogen-specific signal transduction histidine kinase